MIEIRVKICGITNRADAALAVEAGADLLGFIFYAKSPRYVEPDTVQEIITHVKAIRGQPAERPPRFVGVFVNEPFERISAILTETGLDYAQLHSDEDPDLVKRFRGRAFKALRPDSASEARHEADEYAHLGPADGPRWLLDAYDPKAYGGTGKKADWTVAAQLAKQYPGLLLAGGLTPDNVADAIQTVQPWGVDVSSGVEAEPGRKEHARVRAFIARAKSW